MKKICIYAWPPSVYSYIELILVFMLSSEMVIETDSNLSVNDGHNEIIRSLYGLIGNRTATCNL